MSTVMTIPSRSSARCCNHCGFDASELGKQKLLRCSACKSAWFCSREHQRANWKVHRPACEAIQMRAAAAADATGAGAGAEIEAEIEAEAETETNEAARRTCTRAGPSRRSRPRPLLFARPDFLETSLASTAVTCSEGARNTGPLSPNAANALPTVVLRGIMLFCATADLGRLSMCAKFLLATADELALDIAYANDLVVDGRNGVTKDAMAKSLPFLGLKLDATWAERVHRLENLNFVPHSERMLFCNFEFVRTDSMEFYDRSLHSPAVNVRYGDMEELLSARLANLDERLQLGRSCSLLARQGRAVESAVVPAPRPGKALVASGVSTGTAFSAVLRIPSSSASDLPLAKLACNAFRKEWTGKFPLRDSLSDAHGHSMSVSLPLTLDTWETYADSSGGAPSSPGLLRRDEDVFSFRTTLKRRCFGCLVEIEPHEMSCGGCDAASFPDGVASDLAVPVTEFVLWQGRSDNGGAGRGDGDTVHATVRYQDPLGSTGITISSVDCGAGVSDFNYKMMVREIIKWAVMFFGPGTQIKILSPPEAKRRFLEQDGWSFFSPRFALFWTDERSMSLSDSSSNSEDDECCIS